MDKHNPAFTGFFNNSHKRIDLVLVIADGGSDTTEEMRINYLINVIKFGLELELDEGKLFQHRDLLFVKVHAPDSIIEEYGVYFNVRKFFKNSHVDLINPFLYPLGMKNERESIKRLRELYPGPGNYSTLERSKIVYNIILHLPFGQHRKLAGQNLLLKHEIILDAFALHDGPYFLASGQNTCFNARQTLFYNWVGISNIWKTQPIHTIQEYLGERVAMYFAYYEYFNFMLLFPAILGFLKVLNDYYEGQHKLDTHANQICLNMLKRLIICPQCRHFDLCPFRPMESYCKELKFITMIDTPLTKTFAIFISFWSVVFIVLWKRKQNYLTWIWEMKDFVFENVTNPEYFYGPRKFYRSRLTGVTLDGLNFAAKFTWCLHILLFIVLFVIWLFGVFVLSTQIWYVKHWLDKIYNKEYDKRDKDEYSEHLFIGIGAGIYSVVTTPLKMIAKILTHKLTVRENSKTVGSYSCSLALKLYGFYFTGTFALLTLHLFVGNMFYTHLLDMSNWYSIGGFKVMNNGLGTSLDDMCITLAVSVVIEQIIVRITLYFLRKNSDYECLISKNAPSWEREYKLDTLKDEYFHNEYNDIAIQFAMATLFSLTFPLAPLLILVTNIWDIRHKARNLLLGYRRPLLHNNSGPAIWHKIIIFTSYLVPIFSSLIIGLHSRRLLVNEPFFELKHYLARLNKEKYYPIVTSAFELFKGPGSPSEELNKTSTKIKSCYSPTYNFWLYEQGKFFEEEPSLYVRHYLYEYIIYNCIAGVLINLLIYFKSKITQTNDIEDTLNTEWRVKQKYYIRKGFLPKENN